MTLKRSDATRTWQFVKSGLPLFGDRSPGAKQLNRVWGLGPLNGKNPKFTLFAGNVAMPSCPTSTAAGALAESQCAIGVHPGEDGATPSHCSTLTVPCAYPVPTIVNDSGLPAASPGTVNGLDAGVVIVAATAIPTAARMTTIPVALSSDTRRTAPDM